jgi:phosphate uptake regulator
MEAEERTLRLLILQQPLVGQDLRYLTSALHIEMNLKRAGTTNEAVYQEYVFMEQRYQDLSQDLMMMLWKAPAISALQRDTSILQRIAQLLWIAHEMKQLARYAENICIHIVFIVRGKS